MTDFTLYHLSYCPFCHRVRRAAERLGIRLNLVEIREHPEARQLLLDQRGKATVPVLRTGPEPGDLLGESADIIAYLERFAAARDASHTDAAAA